MKVSLLTVQEPDKVPDCGKAKPGCKVGAKEVEEDPEPGETNRGDEEILENPARRGLRILNAERKVNCELTPRVVSPGPAPCAY